MNTFSADEIKSLSQTELWHNSIINIPSSSKTNTECVLYATWDADLNGRKYVSLPADKILTNADKKRYNII
jgi:hypothetical protein